MNARYLVEAVAIATIAVPIAADGAVFVDAWSGFSSTVNGAQTLPITNSVVRGSALPIYKQFTDSTTGLTGLLQVSGAGSTTSWWTHDSNDKLAATSGTRTNTNQATANPDDVYFDDGSDTSGAPVNPEGIGFSLTNATMDPVRLILVDYAPSGGDQVDILVNGVHQFTWGDVATETSLTVDLSGINNGANLPAGTVITVKYKAGNGFRVDDLEFGIVPEPAALSVLGLGALAMGRRRRA